MTPTFVVADRELLAREADLIALRRQVHRQPELAFHEHGTAAMVAERLEACGLQVRRGVAGTGVVAVLSGGRAGERAERARRAVAWRADLDALPIEEPQTCDFSSAVSGVMHACGHDGHTALAVVLAESLAAVRDTIAGEVVFLFQPAEETFRGATRMLAEGVLDAPPVEAIFGLRPR
jgi:amidohydrolase